MRAEGSLGGRVGAYVEGYDGGFEVAIGGALISEGSWRYLKLDISGEFYSAKLTEAVGFSASIAVSSSTTSSGALSAPVSPTSTTSSSPPCISTSPEFSGAPEEMRTSGSAIAKNGDGLCSVFPQ